MDASDGEGEQGVHAVSTSNGPSVSAKPPLSKADKNNHKERNNKKANASLPLSLFFSDATPTSSRHVHQSRTTVVCSTLTLSIGAATFVTAVKLLSHCRHRSVRNRAGLALGIP